jgi:hypothetical protein
MGLLYPQKISEQETQQLVDATMDWILSITEPAALILFGSAARGEMNRASDIDLAIIYADETSLMEGRKGIYRSMNRDNSIWPRDLLFYTAEEFTHRKNRGGIAELIAAEGRVLYGSMQ